MGLGQGRIVEGYLDDNFRSPVTIYAGSPTFHPGSSQKPLGLRTITNFIVSPGTPVSVNAGVACQAQVFAPGSIGTVNQVKIMAQLIQKGRIGSISSTAGSTVFPITFGGTPEVALTPGSPSITPLVGSAAWMSMRSRSKTAVYYRGTPTWRGNSYIAVGPGSLRLRFIAIGD